MAAVLALDVGAGRRGGGRHRRSSAVAGCPRRPAPTSNRSTRPCWPARPRRCGAPTSSRPTWTDRRGRRRAHGRPRARSPAQHARLARLPACKRLAEEFAADRVLIHKRRHRGHRRRALKGAGTGTSNPLGITVSTGVGGGLILDGRLYHGSSGNAGPRRPRRGRARRNPAPAAGAAAWRRSPGAQHRAPRPRRRLRPGPRRRRRVVLAAVAAAGDAVALRHVARAGRPSGRPSPPAPTCSISEVAAIVGGFSQSGPPFWEPLQQAFAAHAGFPFAAACRAVPGPARRPACSARPPSCWCPIATAGTPTRPLGH